MDRATLPGDPPLEIALRRHGRARRVSLRVSRADGQVTLTYPPGLARTAALAFAREKEAWLRATLARLPGQQVVAAGMGLPVEGVEVPLVAAPLARARLQQGVLLVPPGARGGPAAARFLHGLARQRLGVSCARHAGALGRVHGRITLRDVRSRWGSCTAEGNLMFSWRLAMAPPEVLDYVAAHEVAHLQEMNHSAAFWEVVERLWPGHAAPRDWLRVHGGGLLAYRFGP